MPEGKDQNEPIQEWFNDRYEYVICKSIACIHHQIDKFQLISSHRKLYTELVYSNLRLIKANYTLQHMGILCGLFACHHTHELTAVVHWSIHICIDLILMIMTITMATKWIWAWNYWILWAICVWFIFLSVLCWLAEVVDIVFSE